MIDSIPATGLPVKAKKRKRCVICNQMVEIGEDALLTDDRYMESKVQWFGRAYPRGAWHLRHAACVEKTDSNAA